MYELHNAIKLLKMCRYSRFESRSSYIKTITITANNKYVEDQPGQSSLVQSEDN